MNLQAKAKECSEMHQQILKISLVTFTTVEISSQVWKASVYISFDIHRSNFLSGHQQEPRNSGKVQLGNPNCDHGCFRE